MYSIRYAVLLVCFCALPAAAQDTGAKSAMDNVIGPADLIEITVLGAPDFSRSLRVSAAGTIRLPFLGEVEIEGMTPPEVEAKLAALLDTKYVIDPQVSVVIKESRSRAYSILGAVRRPGQFSMQEPTSLISAIAGAGGLDLNRSMEKALIQRNNGSKIEVDLIRLLHSGDQSLDMPIEPGDVISIPERGIHTVFVIGDVNRPGPFELPKAQGIKASHALAMAGGPTKTSRLKKSLLIRQQADGSVERVALNMGRVLKGEAPDVELRANDLLYVPGSVEKNLGWAILQQIPYMATWGIMR